MNNPKVSIIVPVYNVELYLNRCVDSVLSQEFADFECILVNDGSTDNSARICDNYAGLDSRIKVIHKIKNEGASLARKTGLDISLGEYVLFIDSDDWIEKNMALKLYEKAAKENYDMVICDYFIENNGIEKSFKQNITDFNNEKIIKNIISGKIKAYMVNKIVRRSVFLQAVFPKHSRSEDYVLTIQNASNSDKIGYINAPFYHYCLNNNSLSQSKKRYVLGLVEENKNWREIVDFLKNKYDANLKLFEPELSRRVNTMKAGYFFHKELIFKKELRDLYPESKYRGKALFYIAKHIYNKIIPKTIRFKFRKTLNPRGYIPGEIVKRNP